MSKRRFVSCAIAATFSSELTAKSRGLNDSAYERSASLTRVMVSVDIFDAPIHRHEARVDDATK